jgi:hypothetical protein
MVGRRGCGNGSKVIRIRVSRKGAVVRIKHSLAAWAAALTMAAGTFLAAVPAAVASTPTTSAGGSQDSQCSNSYFNDNSLLGPKILPDKGSIAPIVRGYKRLGGLTESRFLATYWDPKANNGKGSWRYPPDNGFLIVDGRPVEFPLTLAPGQLVDRFGSEYGSFLAPQDTPYAERALPPQSLDNYDAGFTCNYHLYRVLKPFETETGPIAPDFGQPGLGLQFQLVSSLLPGDPATANVMWLVSNGYLQSVN